MPYSHSIVVLEPIPPPPKKKIQFCFLRSLYQHPGGSFRKHASTPQPLGLTVLPHRVIAKRLYYSIVSIFCACAYKNQENIYSTFFTIWSEGDIV